LEAGRPGQHQRALVQPRRTNASGGLGDKDVDINALLDPSSETHVRWLQELDQIADGLQQLKDAGVVVLWRPLHEMNGNWFWWGGKDPATFIKLWRQMFDYLTKTKGLDNLLWVYSPGSSGKIAAYYPGDRYVDLAGLDTYTDFVDAKHIKGTRRWRKSRSLLGLRNSGRTEPTNHRATTITSGSSRGCRRIFHGQHFHELEQ